MTRYKIADTANAGSITIAPLDFVRSTHRRMAFSHAISILGPRDCVPFPSIAPAKTLQLDFEDVGYTSEYGRAADENDIGKIIEFSRQWGGKGNMLVHCKAGTSRSPAAAMIALASVEVPEINLALESLLKLKNYYRPNSIMLRIAERLLDRKDLLIEAVRNRFYDPCPQSLGPATYKLSK